MDILKRLSGFTDGMSNADVYKLAHDEIESLRAKLAQPTPSQSVDDDVMLDLYKIHAYIPNDAEGNPLTPFGNFAEGFHVGLNHQLPKPQPTSQDVERLKCLFNHYCAIKQISNTTYEQWLANIDAMKESK